MFCTHRIEGLIKSYREVMNYFLATHTTEDVITELYADIEFQTQQTTDKLSIDYANRSGWRPSAGNTFRMSTYWRPYPSRPSMVFHHSIWSLQDVEDDVAIQDLVHHTASLPAFRTNSGQMEGWSWTGSRAAACAVINRGQKLRYRQVPKALAWRPRHPQ